MTTPASTTTHRTAPLGMTGIALRTANDTITRKTCEIVALNRQLDAALKVNAELLAACAGLRNDLAAAHELIAALEEQLQDAKCALLSAGA